MKHFPTTGEQELESGYVINLSCNSIKYQANRCGKHAKINIKLLEKRIAPLNKFHVPFASWWIELPIADFSVQLTVLNLSPLFAILN